MNTETEVRGSYPSDKSSYEKGIYNLNLNLPSSHLFSSLDVSCSVIAAIPLESIRCLVPSRQPNSGCRLSGLPSSPLRKPYHCVPEQPTVPAIGYLVFEISIASALIACLVCVHRMPFIVSCLARVRISLLLLACPALSCSVPTNLILVAELTLIADNTIGFVSIWRGP